MSDQSDHNQADYLRRQRQQDPSWIRSGEENTQAAYDLGPLPYSRWRAGLIKGLRRDYPGEIAADLTYGRDLPQEWLSYVEGYGDPDGMGYQVSGHVARGLAAIFHDRPQEMGRWLRFHGLTLPAPIPHYFERTGGY